MTYTNDELITKLRHMALIVGGEESEILMQASETINILCEYVDTIRDEAYKAVNLFEKSVSKIKADQAQMAARIIELNRELENAYLIISKFTGKH